MKWILYILFAMGLWAYFQHNRASFYQHKKTLSTLSQAASATKQKILAKSAQLEKSTIHSVTSNKQVAVQKEGDSEADRDVRDAMADMEYMGSKWREFRDSIYLNDLNLSDAELDRIQGLRDFYQEKFNALTASLEAGSAEQKDQIVKEIVKQSAAFNHGVETVIGKDKFAAMEEWKNHFNQEMRKQVRTGVEVQSFW